MPLDALDLMLPGVFGAISMGLVETGVVLDLIRLGFCFIVLRSATVLLLAGVPSSKGSREEGAEETTDTTALLASPLSLSSFFADSERFLLNRSPNNFRRCDFPLRIVSETEVLSGSGEKREIGFPGGGGASAG